MAGLHRAQLQDADEAADLLRRVLSTEQDPGSHPFARKYLAMHFALGIAPGVVVELPVNRDSVSLALAEIYQARDDLDAAIDVVERLAPTQYSSLSLAELYSQVGRHDDVLDITEGIANADDATALLCVFRAVALSAKGFNEAAREVLKDALRSKKRDPVVRHRAILERAKTYLADGKPGQARKDLEKILAEDSDYDGLTEMLASLPEEPVAARTRTSAPQPTASDFDPTRVSSERAQRVLKRQPTGEPPGFTRGRHYTEHVEAVKQLKREGRLDEAEALLLECCDAAEAESQRDHSVLAPWYYDQLGIVYRKLKDPEADQAIRFRYDSTPGVRRQS